MSAVAAVEPFERAQRRGGLNEAAFLRAQALLTEAKRHEAAALESQMQIDQAKRAMHSRSMPRWLMEVVLECAVNYGVSPALVASRCQSRPVVMARNEAVYRARSGLSAAVSIVRISKWFGKDPTTVHHAMAKHAEFYGLPMLSNYSMKVRKRNNTKWYERQKKKAAAIQ